MLNGTCADCSATSMLPHSMARLKRMRSSRTKCSATSGYPFSCSGGRVGEVDTGEVSGSLRGKGETLGRYGEVSEGKTAGGMDGGEAGVLDAVAKGATSEQARMTD